MLRIWSLPLFLYISTSATGSLAGQSAVFHTSPAAGREIDAAVLRNAASDRATASFYERNGWRPVWTAAAAQALEYVLSRRERHALDRMTFATESAGVSEADKEVARTRAVLRYASALAQGAVDPASLQDIYTLPRPSVDLVSGLSTALSSGTLVDWLESLAPQDSEYQALSRAYLQYRAEAAARTGREAIALAGLIRIGDSDGRVPAIVAQLVDSGYLQSGDASPGEASGQSAPTVYTAAAAQAVELLQRDYGIATDGVIGPDTLKVLNLGPAERARALAVALERRRWLSRTPPRTRIDVNTAAARLRYFRDGNIVDSRKVIVGSPGKETPALMSPMYRLVANPTWTVPKSIQNAELANVGGAYLASRNMTIRDGWIVQQPGPDNALGLVKFDMRNDHAIYLHDTAAPDLFDRSERHLSHGCVRVEDAAGFAQLIAEHEGLTEAWSQATLSSDTVAVALPREIPIRMLYHNVFLSDDRQIAFRTDPYGWNDPVAQALGFGATVASRLKTDPIDVGP